MTGAPICTCQEGVECACGGTLRRPPEPQTAALTGESGTHRYPGPSVGRIVHFYRAAARVPVLEQSPMAAIITRVHDGAPAMGAVELEVFGLPEKAIHRTVAFAPVPRPGCWTWPPRA